MWDAAGADPSGLVLDPTQIIIAVCGLMGVVFTAIGGVIVAILNSRNKHHAGSTIADPAEDWAVVRERVAVLEQRAEDHDDEANIRDRRLDQIERQLDLDNPVWRHEGHGNHHRRK